MAYTTIDDPSAYFHVQLYTGDGNDNRVITNDANAGDFKPDLLWLKNRTDVGRPCIWDSSRLSSGEATIKLTTDIADAEANATDRFSGFETDGFTITGSDDDTNVDGDAYVAWQWKANGGTTATNSDGNSANNSVTQVSSTAKFSIITFENGDEGTGTTFGHGLGEKPGFSLIKNRDISQSWYAHWPIKGGANQSTALDGTGAFGTVSGFAGFNASTITQGQGDDDNYVCYEWANVQGFSKFGIYTGNGVANGPVVYTGFRPAFIIIKCTSGTGQWLMFDNKRNENNPTTSWLAAEVNTAETADSNKDIDILSMGFKARDTGGDMNDNGGTYVYAAWAQSPFVTSTGVPTTAV